MGVGVQTCTEREGGREVSKETCFSGAGLGGAYQALRGPARSLVIAATLEKSQVQIPTTLP